MKTKVSFKAIGLRGEPITQTVLLEHPDFVEQNKTVNLNGEPADFTITVDSQIMEWLDNQDKSDLMYDHEWYTILNYSVVKPKVKSKSKRVQLGEIIEHFFVTTSPTEKTQMRADFLATYSKMYSSIKDMSAIKQFEVVLSALEVGYGAATQAYRHTLELLQCPTTDKMRELIDSDKNKTTNLIN